MKLTAERNVSPIPAFDYLRGCEAMQQEITAAVSRVITSGQLILGPEVAAFEREFAQYVAASHAVGVASGTDALILALRVLEIGPGDEVVTVANGPVPTVAAIRAVGAMPKFIDVDPCSLQMPADRVASAITPKTRCILPIHLYGYPAPVDSLREIAKKNRLSLIEDCAQAHGTRCGGTHVGTLGDIGCFSFYPTKNLGAFGDAGMCVTNNARLAESLREQRMYGFRQERVAHTEGLNSRLDELQAAILRVRLRHLDEWLQGRRQVAASYLSGLRTLDLVLPATPSCGDHAWHQFVVRSPQRDQLVAQLKEANIGCGIHYPYPVHLMPAYRWLGYQAGSLPHTERACGTVFSLPLFPELRAQEIDRVIRTLSSLCSTSLLGPNAGSARNP